MHFAIVATALVLTGSGLAAPATLTQRNGAANYIVQQHQIQDLKVTIINVTNDIVQENSTAYDADFALGRDQLNIIINGLQGPASCGPNLPPVPTNKSEAIQYLQSANLALQEVSLALLDPANTIANDSFNGDACEAKNDYFALGPFHP